MGIDFLSQTTWNQRGTEKFRFIVPPLERWKEFLDVGDKENYISDCLTYITQDSSNWYAIKYRDKDVEKYIYVDNKTSMVSYNKKPRLFIDENLVSDKNTIKKIQKSLLKATGVKNVEYVKYTKEEMLLIYLES